MDGEVEALEVKGGDFYVFVSQKRGSILLLDLNLT